VSAGRRWSTWLVLGLGFAFLYLPILVLMFQSLNENRLATVWSGFSLKWYGRLLQNDQMLGAAWVSVRIAFWTATAAVVLGNHGRAGDDAHAALPRQDPVRRADHRADGHARVILGCRS
jgi:ABC-type spermidine/putrescine transport system permease subunit II